MNNSKDERMKFLKDMEYRMWDKGLWDQRIVDCYFQMLMEMDNPNDLAQAVTSVLLDLFLFHMWLEKLMMMIVTHCSIGFVD